jgi:Asp-tRNA(Asn)/Glu-tRNA(Gln) amidotransferase A subunit family amidase
MTTRYTATAVLAETAVALRSGQRDLTDALNAYCDRIEAAEPTIAALLPDPGRRPRLLREAQALLARFPEPADRPPLFGIPVGVKDIFRVDGFATKAGCRLPETLFEGPEAACVTRLKQAGALIVGKTVTTEFAYFEPGPTRNPHNPEHTPGGSSSGSAAGVAAGYFPLALGTQTIGSVIRPAAFCGVIGFKPSYDRIPTDGLLIFSKSADHVGFFTQDIAGLDLAASVLCDDWRPAALRDGLPVLGIPEGPYLEQASADGLAAFRAHAAQLEHAGVTVKRVPALEDIAAINQRHRRLTAAEAAQEHAEWFAAYRHLYRPKTVEVILTGQQVSAQEVADARAGQRALRDRLDALKAEAGIDLWLSPPAVGDAPVGIQTTGDPIMNLPWTHVGVPTLTLPAGRSSLGLPLGVQLSASFGQDEQLAAWAQKLAAALASDKS